MATPGDLQNSLLLQQMQNHAELMNKLGAIDERLRSIDNHAKIINDRVTKAESDIEDLNASRNKVYGGVAVVTFLITAGWQWITGGK